MKTDIIRAIFTNLIFVIGVVLLVVGFIRGSSTVAKFVFFDQYPLNSYEEERCDLVATDAMMPKLEASPSSEEATAQPDFRAEQKEKCLVSVERSRSLKQVEDVVGSISTLVAGAALVISFKRFIFKG